MKKLFFISIVIGIVLSGITGCVSKKYVNTRIDDALDAEMNAIRNEIDTKDNAIRNEIGEKDAKIVHIQKDIVRIREEIVTNKKEISNEINNLKDITEKQKAELLEKERSIVQEAMARAEETGNLKEAKLLYEVTISEESVPFAYNRSELSEDAQAALDIFADFLIKENKEVYIEIQGHTDDIGSEKYNMKLGYERAEAVRRYLHITHNIPLKHIAIFSYGETKPVAPNDSESNRAKNRRVVLMVME